MMNSNQSRIQWSFFVFFIPVFLWLLLLFMLPNIELLRMSFLGTDYYDESGITFRNYSVFFTEPVYWLTFVRTVGYSITVTLVVLIIALPVAFYISKIARLKLTGLLMVMILVPFWVSEIVRVYGLMLLLRESGIISKIMVGLGIWKHPIEMLYNDIAMVMGLVYTTVLFMIIPIIGVMDSLEDSQIEAAYDLGSSKLAIWWQIIIPHCMPGIMSGAIVVFMLVLGNYITPSLMGGKYSLWFTQQIYNQFITYMNWNQGAAFGFLLLTISSLIIWVALRLTGQKLSEVVK
ncbi:MAG: ABC transporter permease [Pseudomonadota bacterium]|nr:ABC transporter permease [Pseudomonadota bacterium]